MKNFRFNVLCIAALASLTFLSACEKKEATPAPTPKAEAPAPTPAAEPAPTTTPAAPATEQPATEQKPMATTLPAGCEAYLATVNTCMEKLGSNAAKASDLKQQMEQARASWAQITDQAALVAACKQVSEAFAANAKAMGCSDSPAT